MAGRTEQLLQGRIYHLPRFPFWINDGEGLRSFFYEVYKTHYEFSMILVRKSVIERPAARTICGTREAAVIPGIVLTSRK